MKHKGRKAWPPELSEQLRDVDRLRRGGRYEQALAQLRQLAEAHPQQLRVLLELALTLGIWGRAPAEALHWYDRVLELAPGHLSTQFHRALALARLGRHEEAVAAFTGAEAAGYRKTLVIAMMRAESLQALGRFSEAERDWTRALSDESSNPWLLQQRATVRTRLGRLEEAIQDLTDALAAQEREGEELDPELLRDRGRLRARLGDTAGARADFEAGLAALREGHPPQLLDELRQGLQEASRGTP
jgi:tetratricopeptide (TPR) repeat protein